MNKIICDVCGTDYPETATQCPICGCASVGAKTAPGNNSAESETKSASPRVKGGRYSKANVRKRMKENQIPYAPSVRSNPEPEYDDKDPVEEDEMVEETSNRGLIIVVIILLLAIVAVSCYIGYSIFGVGQNNDSDPVKNKRPGYNQTTPQPTDPTGSTATTPTTEGTDDEEVSCTGLDLSDEDVYLNKIGSTWKLNVTPAPADTTDTVEFRSTNEDVVTVDSTGLITAVGSGEASIIITCGDIVEECPVLCVEADEETTDPVDPDEETDPTEPEEGTDPVVPEAFELKLKSKDFTLNKAGATYKLYDGEVDASDIVWTTDNEAVVTIKNGVVTAVGNGRTRVYGEYEDQKVTCWVSVKLPAEEVTDPDETTDPEDTEEPEPEKKHTYAIRINGKKPSYGTEQAADVSIAIDEELSIKVVNENGTRVDAEWTVSKSGIVTVGSNTVTGEAKGTVTLSVEIDGQKLTCLIRVTE